MALFPYVVIIILLVHACTLEGSVNGILFFLKPQWSELTNAKVYFILFRIVCFLCDGFGIKKVHYILIKPRNDMKESDVAFLYLKIQ